MLYDGSEEQSNKSNTEELTNTSLVNFEVSEPVQEEEKPKEWGGLYSNTISKEEYNKQLETNREEYLKPWWGNISLGEETKRIGEQYEETEKKKYINSIEADVIKSMETRGLTNLANFPIVRSFQAGLDSLAGGAAQLIGSGWDLATGSATQSGLTQWGAEASMMGNYMSNFTQRELGDKNRFDDIEGVGTFTTWTMHTAAHLLPSMLPWVGWGAKGTMLLGRVGSRIIGGEIATAVTAEGAAAVASEAGWLTKLLNISGIKPSKAIASINTANEVTKKTAMLSRLAAQTPVAFNFGASSFGSIRPDLVNKGMSYDEATYKSFIASLPQAAFAYMPSFGKLNPSAMRFMGEMATMGGINVLMSPIQAMVNYQLKLDKPRDNETYWDYIYRHTTQNMMEPFVVGALFHLMSLKENKFSERARIDKQFKELSQQLKASIDEPSGENVTRIDVGGAEELSKPPTAQVTMTGQIDTRPGPDRPFTEGATPEGAGRGTGESNPSIVQGSAGESAPVRSLQAVFTTNRLSSEKSKPLIDVTYTHSDGTTENLQIIPATHQVNASTGSTVRTADGRTIYTDGITYTPNKQNRIALQKELDSLNALSKKYQKELEESQKANDEVRTKTINSEIFKINKAIDMLNTHLSLNESFGLNHDATLRAIFGEDFSPTVHGQIILSEFQNYYKKLVLLKQWMDSPDGSKIKQQSPEMYQQLSENIESIVNAFKQKNKLNNDIYDKVEEIYGLLGNTDVNNTIKISEIKEEVQKIYESLKEDYNTPHDLNKLVGVVNTLGEIHSLERFIESVESNFDESASRRASGDYSSSTPLITQEVTVGGIKYNYDFGSGRDTTIEFKSELSREAQTKVGEIQGQIDQLKQSIDVNSKQLRLNNEIKESLKLLKSENIEDKNKAIEALKALSKSSNVETQIQAQRELGIALINGNGIEKNIKIGSFYLSKAVFAGDLKAMKTAIKFHNEKKLVIKSEKILDSINKKIEEVSVKKPSENKTPKFNQKSIEAKIKQLEAQINIIKQKEKYTYSQEPTVAQNKELNEYKALLDEYKNIYSLKDNPIELNNLIDKLLNSAKSKDKNESTNALQTLVLFTQLGNVKVKRELGFALINRDVAVDLLDASEAREDGIKLLEETMDNYDLKSLQLGLQLHNEGKLSLKPNHIEFLKSKIEEVSKEKRSEDYETKFNNTALDKTIKLLEIKIDEKIKAANKPKTIATKTNRAQRVTNKTEKNQYGREFGDYESSREYIDTYGFELVSNPVFNINLSDKPNITLQPQADGSIFAPNLHLELGPKKLNLEYKEVFQRVITINDKSYFVREISSKKGGMFLVELTDNAILDSNIVRIETSTNRLLDYRRKGNRDLFNKKGKEFYEYLSKQVDVGMLKAEEANKIYQRVTENIKTKGIDIPINFLEEYTARKESSSEVSAEAKAEIIKAKSDSVQYGAGVFFFGTNGVLSLNKPLRIFMKKFDNLLKQQYIDKDGSVRDILSPEVANRLKQFDAMSQKVNQLLSIKPKKLDKGKIYIADYENYNKVFIELSEMYQNAREGGLPAIDALEDFIQKVNQKRKDFTDSNIKITEDTKKQESNDYIIQAAKERISLLKNTLGHFSDIFDIAINSVKKIKSLKDIDSLLGGAKRTDAINIFEKGGSGNRISTSILSDWINSGIPQEVFIKGVPKSHTFDFLSSTLINKNGQDVFAKTAMIQNSDTRMIKRVGQVFAVNKKLYVVTSIEKLPNLKLNAITNSEIIAKTKFERTALDLNKIASNKKIADVYFDADGNFRQNFELVTYKIIEGNVRKPIMGIDGKYTLADVPLDSGRSSAEYLNMDRFIANFGETMKGLKQSTKRVTFGGYLGNESTFQTPQAVEGKLNLELGRTIYNNRQSLGPDKQVNKPTSSMLTNPTAHTASQAIAQQTQRAVSGTAPTSESKPSETKPMGSEEAISTNETIASNSTSSEEQPKIPTPKTEEVSQSTSPKASEETPSTSNGPDNSGPKPPDEVDNMVSERRKMLDAAEEQKQKFTLWEKFKNHWVSDDSPLKKMVDSFESAMKTALPDNVNAYLQLSLSNQRKNALMSRNKIEFSSRITEPMKLAFRKYAESRPGKSRDSLVKDFLIHFDTFVELRSAPDLNNAFVEWIQRYDDVMDAFNQWAEGNPETMKSKNTDFANTFRAWVSTQDNIMGFKVPRSIEEANRILKTMEKNEPELYSQFTNVHDNLTEVLNQSLKSMVDSGLIKRELYDKLTEKYKYYAPLYAYEDAITSPSNINLKYNQYNERGALSVSGLDLAIKNRLGSGDVPRGDILQHSLKMLEKRARAIAHQPAQQSLYAFVKMGLSTKLFDKNFVTIIDPEAPNTVDSLVEAGMSYSDAQTMVDGFKNNIIKKTTVDKNNNVVIREISVPPPADNVVPINIIESVHPLSGEKQIKKIYLAFDSKNERAMHIAKLYNGTVDAGWMPTGKLGKSYFSILKSWNALNTGFNPFFALKNFTADYFDMLTNISDTPIAGKRWQITKQIPEMVKTISKYNMLRNKFEKNGTMAQFESIIQQDPMLQKYHEYYMNGGSHNFVEDTNLVINEITDNLSKKIKRGPGYEATKNVLDGIGNLVAIEMNSLENSIRFASYLEALNSGMSRDSATLLGKDITANFDRKGITARKINGLYSYTTANIAGQSRVLRSLTGKKGLMIMGSALLAGMAQQSMYDDMGDLESASIPDYVKTGYIVLPLNNGEYMKVRIRGLGAIFNLGRAISQLSDGKTDAATTATNILSSVSFVGPIGKTGLLQTVAPTLIKPLAAIENNQSWTGSKIRNEDPQGLTPKWMLGRAGSNPIADNLAQALYNLSNGKFDTSPQDFEYLASVYSGGAVTQSIQFARSISEIGDDTVYRPTGNPLVSPLPYGKGDINRSSASFVYQLDNDMRRTNQVIKKYIDAGDTTTAQRLINNAKIPYNNGELKMLSRRFHQITEDKNKFVRDARINGTMNTFQFKQKLSEFNKRHDAAAIEYAEAFKKYGVIK